MLQTGHLDSCTGISNVGVHCTSNSSSLGCENPEIISDDLKTIRILCNEDLFATVENSLISNLDELKRNNTIISYEKAHISSHNEMHIHVIVRNRYQVPMIQECLQNVIRPTVVVVNKDQIQYLRGTEGQQFLNFLTDYTDTYIHFPESQKRLYIYGESSKQLKSRSILNRQLTSNPAENIKWYMVDLGNGVYSYVSVKIWYRKIYSYINDLKCRGMVGEYILLEDRPQFWVEATPKNFRNIVNEMDSSLRGNFENQADAISSLVECSICFRQLNRMSDDCCLLSVCGHAYCKECLVQLVNVAAENHQVPICCAFSGCDAKLGASEFRFLCGILASLNSKKLLRRLLTQFVADSSPSVRTCGNARCAGVGLAYEAEGMETCLWCCGRFCARCSQHFHGEIPCGLTFNIKDWITECPDARKRCPKCKIVIEKVEGCRCVYCTWCKTYFCWNCASFNTKDHDNIYRHANICTVPW